MPSSMFPFIVLVLVLLPLMAFASPSDPSWIAGIYDGADGDDTVSLVGEISGIETKSFPAVPRLHSLFQDLLTPKSDIDSAFSSRPLSRGPPWLFGSQTPITAAQFQPLSSWRGVTSDLSSLTMLTDPAARSADLIREQTSSDDPA